MCSDGVFFLCFCKPINTDDIWTSKPSELHGFLATLVHASVDALMQVLQFGNILTLVFKLFSNIKKEFLFHYMSIDISKLTVTLLTVIAVKWTKINHSSSTAVKSKELLRCYEARNTNKILIIYTHYQHKMLNTYTLQNNFLEILGNIWHTE